MTDSEPVQRNDDDDGRTLRRERADFHREVAAKGRRAERARQEGDRTLRTGWGAFGVVGWSIVVPTLLGVGIGVWLDGRVGGGIRFTLSLLVLGLVLGMVNVWNWMNTE